MVKQKLINHYTQVNEKLYLKNTLMANNYRIKETNLLVDAYFTLNYC